MVKILSLIPAEPGWVATVYYGEKDDDGRRTVTNKERHRVHGWALVEKNGATDFEAMYVVAPGTPTCESLYNTYAPDEVQVYAHYEPETTDLNDPRTAAWSAVSARANR